MAFFAFSSDLSLEFLSRAKAAQLSEEDFLADLLAKTAPSLAAKTSYSDSLAVALQRAQAKKKGDEFRVEQLFTATEWQHVQSKKHVGRFFREEAEGKLVEHIGKTETNHAVYRRL
jgi:hypothetical protein